MAPWTPWRPNLIAHGRFCIGGRVPRVTRFESEEFEAARGRIASELRLLVVEVDSMDLDELTADSVSDRASVLLSRLHEARDEKELERLATEMSRLQVVLHEAKSGVKAK
jgi:hypothetical protein